MYATYPCLLFFLELEILIMLDEEYKYVTCPYAIFMYILCMLFSLLSRPTNAQHIVYIYQQYFI